MILSQISLTNRATLERTMKNFFTLKNKCQKNWINFFMLKKHSCSKVSQNWWMLCGVEYSRKKSKLTLTTSFKDIFTIFCHGHQTIIIFKFKWRCKKISVWTKNCLKGVLMIRVLLFYTLMVLCKDVELGYLKFSVLSKENVNKLAPVCYANHVKHK